MNQRNIRKRIMLLSVLLASAYLGGCKSIQVNETINFPDDYRTMYPIVVGEKETKLDILVPKSHNAMTLFQAETLAGFLETYDRRANPILIVQTPKGSENQNASAHVVRELIAVANQNGVPVGKIVLKQYNAFSKSSAPIRFSFPRIQAYTRQCGKWAMDLADNTENKLYPNFGCSYQHNLAAQVANPHDFIGPRKRTPVDGANRDAVIEEYRKPPESWNSEVNY